MQHATTKQAKSYLLTKGLGYDSDLTSVGPFGAVFDSATPLRKVEKNHDAPEYTRGWSLLFHCRL
jgi:hypothetical protein